jgi:hypothetical protein
MTADMASQINRTSGGVKQHLQNDLFGPDPTTNPISNTPTTSLTPSRTGLMPTLYDEAQTGGDGRVAIL